MCLTSNCCVKSDAREWELGLVKLSLQWASILQVGRKSSPESYCFTVDILEPLRMLSCTEYAIESFNTLSVKYIQVCIIISEHEVKYTMCDCVIYLFAVGLHAISDNPSSY
jgi:hypothetical protein